MNGVTSRAYRLLSDHEAVYHFMLDVYAKDWRNGVPAPYLEYALCSTWMDLSHTHRSRLWLAGERIVAFCFTESPATDIYFNLRPGYEALAEEMIAYARDFMPDTGNQQQLILFAGQTALLAAAARAGYRQTGAHTDGVYEFDKPLSFPVPRGFHIVPPEAISPEKAAECCWKGFDHEAQEGPWRGDAENSYRLLTAPHQTMRYAVCIAADDGEYACWAGMWWTPENRLAYMEPLCTIPKYRRRGLAAAALAELYRRMQPLGATHMTGGQHPFYRAIGYVPMITRTLWAKHPEKTQK